MSNDQSTVDVDHLRIVAADVKELLNAISSPYRLMILCLLIDQERNVTEICEALEAKQSLISQHMALLRHMHIVTTERRGHFVYYAIADETTRDIIRALHTRYCGLEVSVRHKAA